jgi:DUF1680 family protein
MYLYSGVADIALEYQDESLFEVCKRIWRNTTERRMYVTGGIGSSAYQEKFTIDYDLPNDRAYTETCAAIGLLLFAHRMLQFEANSEYADIMERVLFNGMLSGISLDGKSYFYVNPLEVWPAACDHREDMLKVQTTRQGWFGCACCPPNIARLLASLGQYIYSVNEMNRELYVHLYIGSRVTQTIGANRLEIVQQGGYPWDGRIRLDIRVDEAVPLTIALRLPGWCRNPQLKVNGETVDLAECVKNGYARVNRLWQNEDQIELVLPMPVEVIRSHPNLRANAGKVALQRGPVVFCLEEADNGPNLSDITLLSDVPARAEFAEQLLGGVPVIAAAGVRTKPEQVGDELYTTDPFETVPAIVTAIPYFAWSNRQPGEMIVWIREARGTSNASSASDRQ